MSFPEMKEVYGQYKPRLLSFILIENNINCLILLDISSLVENY